MQDATGGTNEFQPIRLPTVQNSRVSFAQIGQSSLKTSVKSSNFPVIDVKNLD